MVQVVNYEGARVREPVANGSVVIIDQEDSNNEDTHTYIGTSSIVDLDALGAQST